MNKNKLGDSKLESNALEASQRGPNPIAVQKLFDRYFEWLDEQALTPSALSGTSPKLVGEASTNLGEEEIVEGMTDDVQ